MTRNGDLFVVAVDGSTRSVPNTYEGIKDGLDQATIDFISAGEFGYWLDDDGMIKSLPLNVPASMMTGAAFYGPVVVCGGRPDDEGDSVPPPARIVEMLGGLAAQWSHVVQDGRRKGQDVNARANPATIAPPVMIQITDDAFEQYLATGRLPDDLRD